MAFKAFTGPQMEKSALRLQNDQNKSWCPVWVLGDKGLEHNSEPNWNLTLSHLSRYIKVTNFL